MARTAGVTFSPEVRQSRGLKDDERAVCSSWSRHARKCRYCCDPVNVWRTGSSLCDHGRSYAIDLARYIYSKGARPYSVIDKSVYGQRTELEVPTHFSEVRDLIRAFDKGLELKANRTIVSHDPNYYVSSRADRYYPVAGSRRERYHDDSHDRRRTVHFSNDAYRGSLYNADELARRDRRRYEDEPIIILAQPRSSRHSRYYL